MDHTGERRPWRKGRKRVGADRERPYSELGEFLADLRQSIGLSQHELAEKSLLTNHPFDRTYVARIENGETADTAAKFLTYIALLQAHPETVVEIIESSSRYQAVAEDLPLPEYYANAKQASHRGISGQAVAWILAGLSKARELKDADWELRLRIAAAIIFMSQNAFSIARRFAEDVLNNELASPAQHARAAILLAGICIQLGQTQSARGMIRTIEAAAIEADQELYADYLFQSASVAAALGDIEIADRDFRQAAGISEQNRNDERLAKITYRLARLALDRHDVTAAHDLATEALAIARRGPFELTVGLTYVVLGRICLLQGRMTEARESLLAAETQARRLGDKLMQLESRAVLVDLARRTGDRQLLKYMRQRVDQGLRTQRVPTALRTQIEELLSGIEEGNS